MQRLPIARPLFFFTLVGLSFAQFGCKGPSKANIELRKQNQELRSKVDDLERRHTADAAQLRAMESGSPSTVPSLPQARLNQLFTVHGIQLNRLTGVSPEGQLKVYAVPTDEAGHPIKAAGSFVVDAFDLARTDQPRVGHWEFPLDQARKNWVGQALLHCYVLPLPWQQSPPPQHPQLTVKVSFTDALTGRTFETQKMVRVSSVSASASKPSGR
jgi:hypothetical protein